MRHLKAHRKLGRTSEHRKAMFSNMVASLFQHGQIETTEPKAKELRSVAERAITWAKGVSDLVGKAPKSMSAAERLRIVHAKRMARRVVKNETSLDVLFASIGPSCAQRPGGYTRVLKTRFRNGDAAPMALVQLVDWKPTATAAGKRGAAKAGAAKAGKAAEGEAAEQGEKTASKAEKATKGAKAEKPAKAEKSPARSKSKKSDDE
jgi:large subunit ribosomal protein L17